VEQEVNAYALSLINKKYLIVFMNNDVGKNKSASRGPPEKISIR
jgi:hypothetical protein